MLLARSLYGAGGMADEVEFVPDIELERLAEEHGPSSIEARIMEELRKLRAKDRQVFAFRVGPSWFTGATPDAKTELWLLDLANRDED
jgi:hypothetical protein